MIFPENSERKNIQTIANYIKKKKKKKENKNSNPIIKDKRNGIKNKR